MNGTQKNRKEEIEDLATELNEEWKDEKDKTDKNGKTDKTNEKCKEWWEWRKAHPKFALGKWVDEFLGYWDWPPSKHSSDETQNMMKTGKSPLEIWEKHAGKIIQHHKDQLEYHQTVLKEYEHSKQNETTVDFWEKYWKDTYETKFPNPYDIENRWNDWTTSKDKFWKEEQKRFKKENRGFWSNHKADCQSFSGYGSGKWLVHEHEENNKRERFRRFCQRFRKQRPVYEHNDHMILFQMFDF